MRALVLALRMSRGAERPLLVHVAYLAEACRILIWLRADSVRHLHAHFGTNSAEIAMLVHELGGPQWSFTVHGPEEFDKQSSLGLAEKVRRCAVVVAISSYGRSQLFRIVDTQTLAQSSSHSLRTGPRLFPASRQSCPRGEPPGLRGPVIGAKRAATAG